jgi:hypothetical protein
VNVTSWEVGWNFAAGETIQGPAQVTGINGVNVTTVLLDGSTVVVQVLS